MSGILALARRYRVPVLLHIEWTRMRELSALLEQFPDVAVIWAHGGYTPLFIARRMLERHPNLTYELSARTWAEHPRSPDYTILRDGQARLARVAGADRSEAGALRRRHRRQPAQRRERGDEVRQRPVVPAPAEPGRARAGGASQLAEAARAFAVDSNSSAAPRRSRFLGPAEPQDHPRLLARRPGLDPPLVDRRAEVLGRARRGAGGGRCAAHRRPPVRRPGSGLGARRPRRRCCACS